MNTVVVYVLVIWMSAARSSSSGGPTVIDNISSAENCQAMRIAIERDFSASGPENVVKSRCYAVRKIVTK